eukprot:5547538-Pyramimonas_sp.AAC.1
MEVEQELKRVTAALKELREAHVAAERGGFVREIWEAYKENRFADMHRLKVECQRNGRGPEKRFYFSHRCHWPGEHMTEG